MRPDYGNLALEAIRGKWVGVAAREDDLVIAALNILDSNEPYVMSDEPYERAAFAIGALRAMHEVRCGPRG